MKCAFCHAELNVSAKYPIVKCMNKSCTAYNIPVNTQAYESGMLTEFITFWEAYPKKVAKIPAIRAWIKLAPTPELAIEIMTSVVAHTFNADQWSDKQYIPQPATFINGRKWEDEIIKKTIKIDPMDNRPYFEKTVTPKSTPESRQKKSDALEKCREILGRKKDGGYGR